MATLSELLNKLHPDKVVRGRQFERISKWYLENDPRYRLTLEKVWLWDEWPGRWAPDAGIDLVAKTNEGDLWAIQCKAYDQAYSVTKTDMDKFLSESSRKNVSYRLLITTTNWIGATALRTINAQEKPVGRLLLSDLEKSNLTWPSSPNRLIKTKLEKVRPLPHQKKAIGFLVNKGTGLLAHDVGAGKTLSLCSGVNQRAGSIRPC